MRVDGNLSSCHVPHGAVMPEQAENARVVPVHVAVAEPAEDEAGPVEQGGAALAVAAVHALAAFAAVVVLAC